MMTVIFCAHLFGKNLVRPHHGASGRNMVVLTMESTSECCKLRSVQTRDRIKERKNLESEANYIVKKYLVDLTQQNGVSEGTAVRYYQAGYLCTNLASRVIKPEELQKN